MGIDFAMEKSIIINNFELIKFESFLTDILDSSDQKALLSQFWGVGNKYK